MQGQHWRRISATGLVFLSNWNSFAAGPKCTSTWNKLHVYHSNSTSLHHASWHVSISSNSVAYAWAWAYACSCIEEHQFHCNSEEVVNLNHPCEKCTKGFGPKTQMVTFRSSSMVRVHSGSETRTREYWTTDVLLPLSFADVGSNYAKCWCM